MPFTSNTADLKHYPDGVSKDDTERGYTVIPQPPVDDSHNQAQLTGKTFPTDGDMVKDSD